MVQDGAFYYPPQNARQLGPQLCGQVLVDLGVRYLDLERDTLHTVPDGIVRVRDNRPVIAVKEQLICRLERDHIFAKPPRLDLPKAGQVLHATEREALSLLHFT